MFRAVMAMVVAVSLIPSTGLAQGVAASQAKSERIHVKKIVFTGNASIDSQTLGRVVEQYVNKDLSWSDMQKITNAVTAYYHTKGYYVAKAILPQQNIKDGCLTMQIFEGKLGKISVLGNDRYSDDYIERYFAGLSSEGVIRQSALERSLLLLNDLPGVKASSVLQAGENPGTTDITVNVKELPMVQGFVNADSLARYTTDINISNPTMRGDSLSVRGAKGADGLAFLNTSYSIPLGATGTRLGFYGLFGNFGADKQFADLDISGKATGFGAAISHPLLRTTKNSISAEFGFDASNNTEDILGATSSDDRIRVVRLGINQNAISQTTQQSLSVFVQQGLGSLLGGMSDDDPLSSRPLAGADDSFTKLTLDAARVQRMSAKSFLVARFSGQLASKSLVASQQLAIGGPDSVRGYSQSKYLGDNGVQASLEARFALRADHPDLLQGVVFYDAGWVSVKDPAIGQTSSIVLSGVGIGLRANVMENFAIRADLGFPLAHESGAKPYLQVTRNF